MLAGGLQARGSADSKAALEVKLENKNAALHNLIAQ
jgi:hypothetical protein